MTPTKTQADIEHLWDMIGDIKFAMFTTQSPHGLHARPLTSLKTQDKHATRVSFFVSEASEVTRDVQANPQVGLSYAAPDDDCYVSVSGRAQVVRDLERQQALWSTMAQAWFPGGATDPSLRLLDVDMDMAEYWDVKESKFTQLLKMAKAAVTGQPPTDMGEHGEVKLR